MEVFTWSASGSIITETISSMLPTVLIYVVDTPRTTNPTTFMSNMMYACSIMYKFQIPMIVVFNKVDIVSHTFATDWMKDFEVFQEAIDKSATRDTYMNSLVRSMSLVLDEFYTGLKTVGVSATTGEGMTELFEAMDAAAEEYEKEYRPMLQAKFEAQQKAEELNRMKSLEKLRKDIEEDSSERKKRGKGKERFEDEEDEEAEFNEEEAAEAKKFMEYLKSRDLEEKEKVAAEKRERVKRLAETRAADEAGDLLAAMAKKS